MRYYLKNKIGSLGSREVDLLKGVTSIRNLDT